MPDGRLQEAGSIVRDDRTAQGYGRHGAPGTPEYSYLREVDYCSAACLLVRAERRRASARVEFAGFVPDLDREYDRHRVFVVPHEFAADILKLVEAMSRGIPAGVSGLNARRLGFAD